MLSLQAAFRKRLRKHRDKHGSTAHHGRQYGGHAPPARAQSAAQRESRLSVPEKHQLRIARQNAEMNPAMQGVMGGPSIEESKKIIERLTGRPYKRPKISPWSGKPYDKGR